MVSDYTRLYYSEAHARFRSLEANNAERARKLAAALERIRGQWHNVWLATLWELRKPRLPWPLPCRFEHRFTSAS